MRLIFVGIHNKKAMKPLDSKTVSGKRIDKLLEEVMNNLPIEKIEQIDVVKTNLFDAEYHPDGQEREELKNDFFDRIEVEKDDLVVLLGQSVHQELKNDRRLDCKIVCIGHPSLQWTNVVDREKYIPNATAKILNKLK